MIDQPTAEEALNRLARLVGEWALETSSPDGERGPAKRAPASSGTSPVPEHSRSDTSSATRC
jgi:hypothetical protein